MRLTLILALALLFTACSKDNSNRYNEIINDTMECSYDAGWSVNTLGDAIVGTYEWRFVRPTGLENIRVIVILRIGPLN